MGVRKPAPNQLIIVADGGSRGNPGPAGYGTAVLDGETGEILAERAGFLGVATNNVAEYTGLLVGLRVALRINAQAKIRVEMDSKLVVEQMSGRWKVKHPDMANLHQQIKTIAPRGRITYKWIPREENKLADKLANEAMDERADVVRDYFLPAANEALGQLLPDAASRAEDITDGELFTLDQAAQVVDEDPADVGFGEVSRVGWSTSETPSGASPRLTKETFTDLILIRHGQTATTKAGGLSGGGEIGPELDEEGLAQVTRGAALVKQVGRYVWTDVKPAEVLIASPMRRAQQTAQAVAARTGLKIETDQRLREVEFGDWHDLTPQEVEARWPGQIARFFAAGDLRPDNGESVADVGQRITPLLAELPRKYPGKTVVLAAHAVTIRALIGAAMGWPVDTWCRIRIPLASISGLRTYEDGFTEVLTIGAVNELGYAVANW